MLVKAFVFTNFLIFSVSSARYNEPACVSETRTKIYTEYEILQFHAVL